MGWTIRGDIGGTGDIRRRLMVVHSALQKTILKKATAAAGRIVRDSVREHAPTRAVVAGNIVDLRLLKRSITVKVKTYRGGDSAVAIIGPRTGMKAQIGVVSRGPNKGKPIMEDPSKIGHLVEFGHGGPHPAPAHPFVRTGFEATKDAAAEAMRSTIEAGISQALSSAAA